MSTEAQKARKKAAAADAKALKSWTAPIGTAVFVKKDDGSTHRGFTESDPWILCGSPVIKVSGISGGYLLTRVSVVGA